MAILDKSVEMQLSELEFVVFCFCLALTFWARAYEARQYRSEAKAWAAQGGPPRNR